VGVTPQETLAGTLDDISEGLVRRRLEVASAHLGAIERALLLAALDQVLGHVAAMRATTAELSQDDVLELLIEALVLEARIRMATPLPSEKARA
jgi:hypothetical protein